MARARQGDTRALGELFERYQAQLLAYLLRCTRYDREDARDLLQDIWFAVCKSLHTFDGRRFENWLWSTARKVALNNNRKTRRRQRIAPIDRTADVDRVAAEVEFKPGARLYLQEAKRRLESLPKEQREVLLLLWQGKSAIDIAELLHIEVATVYTRAHRALKALGS